MLVAYAKIALTEDLVASDLPDDPWFARTLRDYFPPPLVRALRRPARLAPAAPRDHHDLPGQRDGQPRRHHLRLPGPGGDGGRRPSRWRAPTRSAARCSACATSWPRSRRWTTWCRPRRRRALYLEFRRLLDRSVRWFLQTRPGPARHRRRDRPVRAGGGRARRRSCRTCSSAPSTRRCSEHADRPGQARRARRRWRCAARACSTCFQLLDVTEIADARRSCRAEEVARVYLTLSERYAVDAMLTRISGLRAAGPLAVAGPGRAALRPVRRAGVADHRRARRRTDGRRAGGADRARGSGRTPPRSPAPRRRWRRCAGWRRATSPRCRSRCAPCAGWSARRPDARPCDGVRGRLPCTAVRWPPCPR